MSKWLHTAFDLRQIADYRELMDLTDSQAEDVLRWAADFVAEVERFLAPKLEHEHPNAHV